MLSAAQVPLLARLVLLPVMALEGAVLLSLVRSGYVRRLADRGPAWRYSIALIAFSAVFGALVAVRLANDAIVANGPRRLDGILVLEYCVGNGLMLAAMLWGARKRRSGR